jgi:hypothetical protein
MTVKKYNPTVPKEIDRSISGAAYNHLAEYLPNTNINRIIKIMRTNYSKNGLVKIKIEGKMNITCGDIYKIICAHTRHAYSGYNSKSGKHNEFKNAHTNHAMVNLILNNNQELIRKMVNNLDEGKIPTFNGKLFPNFT